MSVWQTLGRIAPEELASARLELHHAAQLPAIGVGRHLVPQRDDDGNTALTWDPAEGLWLGEEIPGTGVRAGLRPADLTLVLARGDGESRKLGAGPSLRTAPSQEGMGRQTEPQVRVVGAVGLAGKTLGEGADWLRRSLRELGVEADRFSMDAHFEIPGHPVASGEPFDPALLPRFAELGRWYHCAYLLLREIALEDPGAAPIRTWPHHFDIATLLHLDERRGEEARSIGVGLSPGDGDYPVPYFYVTPWPHPRLADPPVLPGGGRWHTEGWTGAVLPAPQLTGIADGGGQEARARVFLAAAVEAARVLLERGF